MKSMTLLKAMSELEPQDIDAAMKAGAGGRAAGQDFDGEESAGHGRVIIQTAQAKPLAGRNLRIGGWVAVAACLTMAVGAVMLFNRDAGDLVLTQSAAEQIAVETGTETGITTAAAETQTTAKQNADQANPAVTVVTTVVEAQADQTDVSADPAQSEAEGDQTTAAQETETAETTTTAAAVTYPAEAPVLIAMADDAGTMAAEYANGQPEWTLTEGADAVNAYMNSPSPVVTLGEGQKSAAVSAAIMQNPVMCRIRWQKESHKWNSYGIRSAELDADGVLHLNIAMYADGGSYEEAEWIYETALLFEAGTVPQITDVRLDLTYFEDTDGIEQWFAYQAALAEDVNVHINK